MVPRVCSLLGSSISPVGRLPESAWAATRCSLGKRGFHGGLYSPPDIEAAAERYGANCGPATLSALTARPICEVMRWFPKFPTQAWTTKGDMKKAAIEAGWEVKPIGSQVPDHGCLLIELLPQTEPRYVHPCARLKRSHWVGCHQGLVYDVNWEGWLPVNLWERLVLPGLLLSAARVRGWRPLDGLELRTTGSGPLAEVQRAPERGVGLQIAPNWSEESGAEALSLAG